MKKSFKSLITMLLVVSLLMSNFAMIITYAVREYPVELAFNNIFVFDKWAGNSLSTTMVNGSGPVEDELDINIENGSFRFNNQYSTESYTGHGMGTGGNAAGNYQYYYMEVEPNAAYTFSYNVTQTTEYFTPYVFFFNENNEYLSLIAQPFSGNGDTSFVFVAPSNAHYIQIRFTLPNTGYADVKDIAIRKTEIASYGNNIFDFNAWANNANSGKVSDSADYNGGTISKNTTDNSVTLTTNGNAGILFTNFIFGDGNGYYMMDVEPNTRYNFSYNLASCNFAVGAYQPYVAYYDANGQYISYINSAAVSLGTNRFVFMTPANAEFIQIVYGVVGAGTGKSCTVKDVAIQKLNLASDTNADLPHRLVYTYSKDTVNTYGELPVPSYAPAGYVFAGWYTGLNGEGTHITADTAVDYSSHTVYPKYEPKVDSLSVATMPVKTSYTVGERVNPTGLVLNATLGGATRPIDSGYYCTPEYLTATGTQTVTAHYGGRTATFTVNVSASASRSVVINGSNVNASVTNNVYTFGNYTTSAFNRYEMTYYSDSYVKGIITYNDNVTEEFFLEPSSNFDGTNGEFSSYIDGYLNKILEGDNDTKEVTSTTRNGIKSIAFELLDNKSGTFELLSVKTELKNTMPKSTLTGDEIMANTLKLFNNDKYKVGIDILNGGVVSYLEVLNSNIVARVYFENDEYITRVDYADKLPGGHIAENTEVNLINYYDNGRYLQQSYYGTGEKPYEQGYYNSADWNYNPVQGGNVIAEASKVIDYEIGDDYIYIKARPLDWAKWSDDFANLSSTDNYEPIYGDEYVTDTYVEARYVFEDGMMKVYNRMVDYSGLPTAQTTQELPAFYTIEPLNHYVYNDVSDDNAWKTKNLKYDKEPEFWGITQDYINNIYPDGFNANRNTPEHWAAFMASDAQDSFGIGLYSPEVTNFFYGIYPPKYDGESKENTNYRHAESTNPAVEDDSSYIAPVEVRTFESFKPTEYSYYISTGTVDQIRNSFGVVDDEGFAAELEAKRAAGTIGVPETIYMTPSTGQSKTGQYFVNNKVNGSGDIALEAINNNAKGEISVYAPGSTAVKFNVTAVNGGIGEPVFGGTGNSYENTRWDHSLINTVYQTGAAQDWFVFNALEFWIDGTGLTAGKTALLEWEVTIYYGADDQTGVTHYAYTTLYAPNYHSVGATAEAKHNNSNRLDSAGWISGVHNVTSSLAPFGKSSGEDGKGIFKSEPLMNILVPMVHQGWGSANNLASSSDGNYVREYYYGSGNDSSHMQSYTGVLYVDYSRNKNTNTIPNVYIGTDLLGAEHSSSDTGCHAYAWYTLGTGTEFNNPSGNNPTPSGWKQFITLNSTSGSYDATIASSLNSGTNLNQFRAILNDANSGRAIRWYTAPNLLINESGTQYIYLYSQMRVYSDKYANTYSAVQLITLNKSAIRDLVFEASKLNPANYTTTSWDNYIKEVRKVAENLGNPSASSLIDTSALITARNALQTVVTLNVNGINTNTFNATVGANLSATYDVSPYTATNAPEGYHFAGWSTDKNATVGSTTTIRTGLKPTFYAVWEENSYNVSFNANGGSGFVADKTVKISESFMLPSYEFSKTGYTLLGWSENKDATEATYGPGATVSQLRSEKDATVTLYAIWKVSDFNVTFDNLIDFSAWEKRVTNDDGAFSEISGTGFTITSDAGVSESTSYSQYFKVEPGKKYRISVDIIGEDWDVYIFYHTATSNGNGVDFSDTATNRYSSNRTGNYFERVGNTTTSVFTVPDNEEIIKARIRVDCNGKKQSDGSYLSNTVTFTNIRVCEDTGVEVSPVNKYVTYNSTFGDLPTPNREGYDFVGWYDANNTEITASSVLETASTVFLTSKWNINNDALEDDFYVIDFGLPVDMKPFDNDTILASDGGNYSISGLSTSTDGSFSKSVDGKYGTFTLVDNETVKYTPKAFMNDSSETVYCQVAYSKGAYTTQLVSTIRIIPATVVYYEDDVQNAITYTNGVATSGDTGKWSETGSSNLENVVLDLSDKVYGYDKAYNNTDTFSMNSAHVVSVSKYNNPQGRYNGVADNEASWPVAEFTFAGTGFDVVSLISKDTGAIEVKVIDVNGATVRNWVVDTYYGYTIDGGKWVVNSNADNALYQIPVISNNELPYGTYTVKIIPTYTSRLDHQKDGAYDFYLDAIRVYNPMGDDIDAATVYLNNGEYVVAHQNIRDILINAGSFGESNENQVVYINPGMTEGSFENYSLAGPKNEVYLAKGQSVAFNMTVTGFKPTSVQISAHSLDGTADMRIASGGSYSNTISISHNTTLYYSAPFTASEYWLDNENGTYSLKVPIVITNNGDGILSLCNIKVTSDASAAYEPLMFMMSDEDFDTAVYSVSRVSDLTADDGALFVPDDMEAETDNEVVEKGEEVLVTINTSAEVYALTVNGEDAVLVSTNDDGTKTWNYTFVTYERGEKTFTLVAYDVYGFASEETTVTVDVQSKIEIFFTKLTHFFKMIVEFIDNIFGN